MEYLFARNALDLAWDSLTQIAADQCKLIGTGQRERTRANHRRAQLVMEVIKSLYQDLEEISKSVRI